MGFSGGSVGKKSSCNAGGPGSVPGSGRSSGEGNGKPLLYSCLVSPLDGGAWWAYSLWVTREKLPNPEWTKYWTRNGQSLG